MPLVRRRELIQRTHVRRDGARIWNQLGRDPRGRIENRGERPGEVADAAVIVELRQRVGGVRLPVVAEPLGERVLPPVVVRAAIHDLSRNRTPCRERQVRQVGRRAGGGIDRSGRRIDRAVDVLAPLFLAATREHEVRIQPRVRRQLALHADRDHVAVRRLVRVERNLRSVLDLARVTVRCVEGQTDDVARAGEHLLVRRLRTAKRIQAEVRPSAVIDGDL